MPNNNALTLDCIMRIMRAEIPHAYFNSPAAGERFARAIESEVLASTQQPNYCDIHCKKFCQNSVHGMCDGPPAKQTSIEVTDAELLEAMAPHLNDADGGYVVDYAAQSVVAAGRAAIAINAARTKEVEFSEQQPSGATSTGSLAFDYANAEVARKLGIRNPLVSNQQSSGEVMENRILELADKYRIDYGGDYSRNAKEHEIDLLAFARAVLLASTQQLSGLSELLRNHAIYHESCITAKVPEVVEHVKKLRAWSDALDGMSQTVTQQPSGK